MKVLVASGLAAYDDSWDDHKNRNIRSEILYVILRNKKVSSIFSSLAEVCPAQGNKGFGASWNVLLYQKVVSRICNTELT